MGDEHPADFDTNPQACPKCGFGPLTQEECPRCGVLVSKYQSIVDAEWNIIYSKLAECANSGAQIVLSRCVGLGG